MMVHGLELESAELPHARVALIRHRAGQRTPRHDHARACTHVVLRGVYVEHSPSGTVVACPGDTVRKPPEAEHWNRFGTADAESLRFELTTAGEPFAPTADAEQLERMLRLGRSLAAGATARADRPQRVSPEAELLVRLRRRFRERVRLGELARELGTHRSHLSRQFARRFGCSPQAYVALKRTAWVAEQLALGGVTLTALAADAGFADQSHCTRTFRRVFGTTPTSWDRDRRQ